MRLREAMQQDRGFRYMVEQLNISSALGRRWLYEMPMLTEREAVEKALAGVMEVADKTRKSREKIKVLLMQVRDIQGTAKRVAEEVVLDDLELFELKNFALLAEELRQLTPEWTCVKIPSLDEIVKLLDPEGTRLPHFYIYGAYSEELVSLRKKIKEKQQQGAAEQEVEALYFRSVEVEDRVRERLSRQLKGCFAVLQQALAEVARLDILLAKAEQAEILGLQCPRILTDDSDEVCLQGLFHPQLRERLRKEGKDFQPVDLYFSAGATVITGANMAGKTVLLKSVALAQHLLQFGFFVPAREAWMQLVEEVVSSIGDEQDELHGLSSFAAEMLRINEIVVKIKEGRKLLVLVDELARTTNPAEGRAIVNGMVEFLTLHGVMSLVTTHYSGIKAPCRKLRVKGFVKERIEEEVTLENINIFMDYSLEEEKDQEVPHEALRIARMLGIDPELLQSAEHFLTGQE